MPIRSFAYTTAFLSIAFAAACSDAGDSNPDPAETMDLGAAKPDSGDGPVALPSCGGPIEVPIGGSPEMEKPEAGTATVVTVNDDDPMEVTLTLEQDGEEFRLQLPGIPALSEGQEVTVAPDDGGVAVLVDDEVVAYHGAGTLLRVDPSTGEVALGPLSAGVERLCVEVQDHFSDFCEPVGLVELGLRFGGTVIAHSERGEVTVGVDRLLVDNRQAVLRDDAYAEGSAPCSDLYGNTYDVAYVALAD
tara:strand:+ start:931 stop:1671 length:741 start_codon:yes stop_codon:yes gene_type:complete